MAANAMPETTAKFADDPAPFLAFVDTNVLIEFYHVADLDRAVLQGRNIAQRHLWAQGTLWLAMALNEVAATTLSLRIEAERISLGAVPPDSPGAGWTSLVAHFVKDYILPNWNNQATNADQGMSGTNCDRLLVSLAKERGIPVITRAADVQRFCTRDNVAVFTPEDFASHLGLPLSDARQRFRQRFDSNALRFAADWVSACGTGATWWRDAEVITRELRLMRRAYCWLWGDLHYASAFLGRP